MEKNLKRIVLFCLSVIPFLAWYVADGRPFDILPSVINTGSAGLFFPFITGKNFAFRILVEIAFVAWIFLAVRFPQYRLKKTALLLSYSVFLVVLFVADLFGVDPMRSFFSNYERMEGFVTHIHLFAFFIMLVSLIRTKDDWLKFFKIAAISNVCVLLWGYLQLIGSPQFFIAKIIPSLASKMNAWFPIHMSEGRLDSSLGNSAYFAIYTALFIGIFGILYLYETKKSLRTWYIVLMVLNLIALYYTATRGTVLGLIAGAFLGLTYMAFKGEKKGKKIALGLVVTMVILVAGFIAMRQTSFVKNSPVLSRFAAISATKDMTTKSRIMLWGMSYEGFKKNPILGYGQDNFGYVFAREYNPEMYGQEPWFDRSHDVFFDWLIAGGILGLLSYLSLFAVALYLIFKKGSVFSVKEQALLLGILTTYFVHNVLVFDNLVSYILFFMLLAYIAVRTENILHTKVHAQLGGYQYIIEPLAVLFVIVIFWFGFFKPLVANQALIRALDVSRLSNEVPTIDKVILAQIDYFNKALAYNSFGNLEIKEQLLQAAVRTLSYSPQFKTEADKNAYVQAVQAFLGLAKKEIDESSKYEMQDPRELTLYGSFFNNAGAYTNAETYLVKAHAISPKKQLSSFSLVLSYLGQGKVAEAYNVALETYLYAPAYDDALSTFAIASVYAQKEADAKKIMQEHNQTFPLTPEVINAYVNTGKTSQALALLAEYKKANPASAAEIDALIKTLLAPKGAK